MTTKIFTIAHLPPGLEHDWLQHLRDFDTAHPGCHFEIMADTPTLSLPEIVEMIRVNPDLSFSEILLRDKNSAR